MMIGDKNGQEKPFNRLFQKNGQVDHVYYYSDVFMRWRGGI